MSPKREKKDLTRRGRRGGAAGSSDPATRLESRLSDRAVTLWVAGLLIAMALIRVAYLVEFRGHVLESSDTTFFVEDARRIAAGDLLLSGRSLVFSPLYAYFLGLAFAAVGEHLVWVLALQFILSLLGAWLLYRLARELFGPLAGLFTLGLTAFYGLSLIYEGQILDAFLSMLLPTVFLLLLQRALASRGTWRWGASGAALGIFALTRPNVLLFLPFAIAWALFAPRKEASGLRRVAVTASLVAGTAAAILPFTVRNWIATGEPVLITSHGGINFYIGNNEHATGFFTPPPGFPPMPGVMNLEIPRLVAEAKTGRSGMSDAEVSDYWFAKGLEFIRDHSGRFVALTLRKTRAFFNGYEVPLNVDYNLLREISTALKIAFVPIGLVMPLGLAGMMLAARDWRRHLLFYIYFVAYAVSIIIFFVTARYRLPVVPVLLLYAGFALRSLFSFVRRPGKLAALVASLVVLTFFVNASLGLHFNQAYLAHSQAFTLEGLGRVDEAVARYRKALSLNPNLLFTHLQLARIFAHRGQLDQAAPHYEAAARLAPNDSTIRQELDLFRKHLQEARGGIGVPRETEGR